MKNNRLTFWQSRQDLGIGCIVDIRECPICGHEIAVGEWNRTDGTGEYIDYNVDVPDVCPVCEADPDFGLDREHIASEIKRFRRLPKKHPFRELAENMAKLHNLSGARYVLEILRVHDSDDFEKSLLYDIAFTLLR